MSLLSRLNRRFGRFAVPNLTAILIAGQILAYIAGKVPVGMQLVSVLENIRLVPDKVIEGEVWRVVTFLFDPPSTNLVFAVVFWYLFYLMGTTLESVWGDFRYNVYLGIGYVASLAWAFGFYIVSGDAHVAASNVFLEGTVFLAFARLYPDFVLYLLFLLPVKVKWLALIQWIMYAVGLINGPWMTRAMIVAAVLNYFLFFGRDIWRDARYGHRRMKYQAKTKRAPKRIRHECRVCGLTSEESPQTQFRYCSQCEGECCYCPEHLRDHEHVTGQGEESGVGGRGSKARHR